MIWIFVFVFGFHFVESIKISRYNLGLLSQEVTCALPPFPDNGAYALTDESETTPFLVYPGRIYIRVICDPEYSYDGPKDVYCRNGNWSDRIARCVKTCPKDFPLGMKLYYKDEYAENDISDYHHSSELFYPRCEPPYYQTEDLPPLKCTDETWNYKPECTSPVCGLQKQLQLPSGAPIDSSGGWNTSVSELPWHVVIYEKSDLHGIYVQTCGGSVVARNVVISAAHCFWSDVGGLQPASRFAVAGGKLHRAWDEGRDFNAQKSDVYEIVIPPRFRGMHTNFQDDIALVFLRTHFDYNRFLWPICIDFDARFDNKQLAVGQMGIFAGWGSTEQNDESPQTLQALCVAYVDVHECIANSQPDHRAFITSDKFCARNTNGSAAYIGAGGGGLAFFDPDGRSDGTGFYYLRGVLSTSPKNEELCNTLFLPRFTRVAKHEDFFQRNFHKIVW